jgi:hypothetical protein
MEALYIVKLANPEYVSLFEDIIRMVTIQCTIQFLYYINNGTAFLTADFFLLVLYVVLGVCVYWLVFKKLILFK